LLPYALIPAVGALLAYTIYIRADDAFQPGVYAGAAVLTVLVVVSYPPRQWVLAHP